MQFTKIVTFLLIILSVGNSWGVLTPSKYIYFQGVKIAVYESHGKKGPGILLLHGNTSAANSFEKIMESTYANKNRIVAIDMPGYGNSDNAPSYNTGYLAQAVTFAANSLNVAKGVMVGWSLGGDILLQASSLLPQAKGYFVFGTAPIGYDPQLPAPFLTPAESYAGEAVNFGFVGALPPDYINAYVTAFFRPNYVVPQQFFADGQRTDPATRDAVYMVATGQDPTFLDELVIVRNLQKPIAMILADQDAFVRPAFLEDLAPSVPQLYKHKIIHVDGGHATHWEKPNRFIFLLENFVDDLH